MSSTFVSSHQLPDELLRRYLLNLGNDAQITEWKYFDHEFNRGRSRAHCYVRDGEIQGMAGLIPFTLGRGAERWPAHWMLDWSSIDPVGKPGIGVRVAKSIDKTIEHGVILGGNNISIPLLERLFAGRMDDATSEYRLLLRLDPLLKSAQSRIAPLKVLARTPLKSLPLPRLRERRQRAWRNAEIELGVSEKLQPLLDICPGEGHYALYDLPFLQWQIGRCPILSSATVTLCDRRGLRAGALLWRHQDSVLSWRAAVWARPGSRGEYQHALERILLASTEHIYREGGALLSLVVSRGDEALKAALTHLGFRATRGHRALYAAHNAHSSQSIVELSGLNFLAADLSYRF